MFVRVIMQTKGLFPIIGVLPVTNLVLVGHLQPGVKIRETPRIDGVAHAFFYSQVAMDKLTDKVFTARRAAETHTGIDLTLDSVRLTRKVADIHGDFLIDANKLDLDYVLTARYAGASNYEMAQALEPVMRELAKLGMTDETYRDNIAYDNKGHSAFLHR